MTPIYIVHYYELTDRRNYLEKALPSAHFITRYNFENLTSDQINSYNPCKDTWGIKSCSSGVFPEFRKLTPGMISCLMGHREVLRFISENDENAIILEDDAILNNGVNHEVLSGVVNNAPSHDILFLGGGFPHQIAPEVGVICPPYRKKGHPASNTVCAYAVTNAAAKKIVAGLETFTMPIDFELNYIMQKEDMEVWHHIPYLIREGSSIGIYKSSQERK